MKPIAVIDRSRCKAPNKCDYLCMRVCPIQKNGIKVFEISEEDQKPVIIEEACIGCGLCVKKCPFKAIKIINLLKEPDKSPVFQYGPNSFRLYRLPYIKKGAVVGIIGRNGMGKSTAIKILAGILRPNFGRFKEQISDKEIIDFFKGSEMQAYFQKLFNKEIKLSYKPQEIYLFVKLYGEKTLSDIVSKVDLKEKVEEVLEKFRLKHLLDRKVKQLSGGELQRFLVAITSLKDANVYLFDEPTAFLDIYERLNVATFIDSMKSEETSLLVIDHDLLFLDFLSDIVHIVYGVQKAYGVFSYPIGAKEGINQFLEGFIKRENLRIRDKAIKLDIKPFSDYVPSEDLVSWSSLKKSYESFEFTAEEGVIHKGEIIGAIGRNGIGKTTFAKMLAGLIEFKGEVSSEVSVAYKPQFIEVPEDLKEVTVHEFLKELNRDYRSEFGEWVGELGIADLYDHELASLSGGELQTVYTFATIIQDKDLYVIDEPFAFLDIEQRLLLSKFLRENLKMREKSAIIIEHDLLFVDYISDKIMVFVGEPGVRGRALPPMENKKALNEFLKEVGITVRRDPTTKRPRINKPGSYLDRQQREAGLYYAE